MLVRSHAFLRDFESLPANIGSLIAFLPRRIEGLSYSKVPVAAWLSLTDVLSLTLAYAFALALSRRIKDHGPRLSHPEM